MTNESHAHKKSMVWLGWGVLVLLAVLALLYG